MINKRTFSIVGVVGLFSAICTLAFAVAEGGTEYSSYSQECTFSCHSDPGCWAVYRWETWCGYDGNAECEATQWEDFRSGYCYTPTGSSTTYCIYQ